MLHKMGRTGIRSNRKRAADRRRRRAHRQRLAAIGAVAAGVLVLGGLVFLAVRGPAGSGESPGELVPSMGNQHIAPPETFDDYNTTPPTSGPHYGQLASWGVHDEQIPNELQIHNLEDGGVGVQYNCPDDCPELVGQLERIVRRYPDRVFMAPYPDMERTIALTAWTRIDTFDEFDEARIVAFIEAYRGLDHHTGF